MGFLGKVFGSGKAEVSSSQGSSSSKNSKSNTPHSYSSSSSRNTKSNTPYSYGSSSSGNNDEIFIAVLGVTGSGKTSFIRTATGDNSIVVGNGLFSDTSDIKEYRFMHKNVKYVLIDTPGFNDSTMGDEEVTAKISSWLESSYSKGTFLSSIIYIHDITKTRMAGSATRNMRFFRKLIKENTCLNVTLATTFWDLLPSENVGIRRELELRQSKDFWADMVAKGSEVVRIHSNRNHCLQILEQVAARVKTPLAAFPVRPITVPKDEIQETRERLRRERQSEKKRFQKGLEKKQLQGQREMQLLQARDETRRRKRMEEQREVEENFRRDMETERLRQYRELEYLKHQAYLQSQRQKWRDNEHARREREHYQNRDKALKDFVEEQNKQREIQQQIEYETSQEKQRQTDYDGAQAEKRRRDTSPEPRPQCTSPNFTTTTYNGSCYNCGSFHNSRCTSPNFTTTTYDGSCSNRGSFDNSRCTSPNLTTTIHDGSCSDRGSFDNSRCTSPNFTTTTYDGSCSDRGSFDNSRCTSPNFTTTTYDGSCYNCRSFHD